MTMSTEGIDSPPERRISRTIRNETKRNDETKRRQQLGPLVYTTLHYTLQFMGRVIYSFTGYLLTYRSTHKPTLFYVNRFCS